MIEKLINVAAKREKAELVLKNARYVNVFNGKIESGDIAIHMGKIAGIGSYSGVEEIDVANFTVVPGYIDGHVHIESSQLSPEEYASLIVPRGTTTIVADPHEIGNVCGMPGIEYIAKASENVPLDVKIMLPSCVPATPFETSGAVIDGAEIERNIDSGYIYGLAEFMNYPGVIGADPDVIKKLEAAQKSRKVIDGHAPTVVGDELNAYICGGISTDHECVENSELEEKLAKGMYVHLRHGSSTRNLVSNSKSVTASNMRRFIICADDRHAADLKEKGDMDDALRTLVRSGFNPIWAVTIATLNTAEAYGMKWKGGIAPNWTADLVVVDDLENFNAKYVFKDGKMVAKDGKPLFDTSKRYLPEDVLNTVHVRDVRPDDFKYEINGNFVNAMTIKPGNIVTGSEVVRVKNIGGDIDVSGTDLLKLVVVERHGVNGNIGKGILKGYGFRGGAMGITIAHDSHNIILLGDDNASMARAVEELKTIGGGMVIVDSAENRTYSLPLDIGGLMSSKAAESLQRESKALIERAYSMGVDREQEAFMSLAFLSLSVIPKVKILDTGLFDVDKFAFMPLEAEEGPKNKVVVNVKVK
ncbi:MAG: adenine deaminase [Clostridia bacterium]|nr:adenine deaminase [Clostridia bacterium]